MERFDQPIESLLGDMGGVTESLEDMTKKLMKVLDAAKKEMNEEERKVFDQFEKDAVGLSPEKLQQLRDSYHKKFKDAKL